jgi:hypothetical protein
METSYASRYKGVYRTANRSKPRRAVMVVKGRKHNLGVFETEEGAAAARRDALSQVERRPRRGASAVGIYDDDREWVEIELTQGRRAKVDKADVRLVIGDCWAWDGSYAIRMDGKKKIYMHRLILALPPGRVPEVDHRNGDRTDNRRSNLRLATRSQQCANQRKTRGSSKYKGVYWDTTFSRWKARITVEGSPGTSALFHRGGSGSGIRRCCPCCLGRIRPYQRRTDLTMGSWERDHAPRRRSRVPGVGESTKLNVEVV